jgi:hypothetical protein
MGGWVRRGGGGSERGLCSCGPEPYVYSITFISAITIRFNFAIQFSNDLSDSGPKPYLSLIKVKLNLEGGGWKG